VNTVVHFVDSKAFGGTEKIILIMLAGLNRERWRSVLFHHPEPGLEPLLEGARRIGGVELRALPRLQRAHFPSSMVQLHRALHAEQPAVFHAHLNWPFACKGGLAAAALARIPAVLATVQTFASLPRSSVTRTQRIVWIGVDRFLAVSEWVARGLRHVAKIPSRKIRVVRNGIPLANYDHPVGKALRETLLGDSRRPIVLTAARLHEQKGHRYLLEAATMVPDAAFVFAGEGPLRAKLEMRARALGLNDRVILLGHRKDIPDLLAACDVFVLPSLFEGYPLAVMEAAAAGRPIVATAVGGTDEAIRCGQTGLLVPPANPRALADAIRRLLADPALAARLAHAAKAHALQEFSAEAMCQRTVAVYEEVLAMHRGRNGTG
jgi:glycosyltransferase involved in cell wall biosynthesis